MTQASQFRLMGGLALLAVVTAVPAFLQTRESVRPKLAPAQTQRIEPLVKAPSAVNPVIGLPIAGLRYKDIRDSFQDRRGANRSHEATDILAPRGTPVFAVADGTIQRLFFSKPGGITIYEFGLDEKFCFYYAHLERYADGLAEGMRVARGQTIGYVGTSGNAPADTPHLHFAIFLLGAGKKWWEGEAINPYPALMDALKSASTLTRPRETLSTAANLTGGRLRVETLRIGR